MMTYTNDDNNEKQEKRREKDSPIKIFKEENILLLHSTCLGDPRDRMSVSNSLRARVLAFNWYAVGGVFLG
jgi:hypothetical protein